MSSSDQWRPVSAGSIGIPVTAPKCAKHGVTAEELESIFRSPVMVLPDAIHSTEEVRYKAIGQTPVGRYVFIVFTVRTMRSGNYIRPISARYMHRREIEHYEKENPAV